MQTRSISDQVIYHESGHILIARALKWKIDKLDAWKNGSPLSVAYLKQIDDIELKSFYKEPTTENQICANLERLLISQGGWAAENMKQYDSDNDAEQFIVDNENAELIKDSLSMNYNINIQIARETCLQFVKDNSEHLETIANGIRELISKKYYDLNSILINNDGLLRAWISKCISGKIPNA